MGPGPGYDFADYVHTTLTGEAVTLQTEDYGLSLTKTWSWISGPVTITLDSNGHGCPPDPIEVPRGGCLYDVMDIPENWPSTTWTASTSMAGAPPHAAERTT